MNCEQFAKSAISPANIAHVVMKYFDELMVLYNVIGQREDINISTNIETSPITFNLKMLNKDEAEELMGNINGINFTVFNTRYSIDMTRNRNIIYTIIKRAS